MRFTSVAEFLALTGPDAPSTAEKQLIEATQAGRDCVLCDRDPKKRSRPTAATDKTRIRAPPLRLLITGGTPACGLHERGVTLIGGWIDGMLDLAYCTAKGQTVLEHCRFSHKPDLPGARIQRLSLAKSFLPGLNARNARVEGDVSLQGSVSTAVIDVSFSTIGAQLDCNEAELSGTMDQQGIGRIAMRAEGLHLVSDLVLTSAVCVGTLDLTHAWINGQLDCTNASFDIGVEPVDYAPNSPTGDNDDDFHAISARRLHV